MSDLIPYERYSCSIFGMNRLYPTGKRKRKTILYEDGSTFIREYIECRRKVFGIFLWKRWVAQDYISWQKETVEIFDCKEKHNG